VVVNDVEDLLAALNYGSNIRQTDATAINARSSRSHAVFSLSLVQRKRRSVGTTSKKDQNRRWTISGIDGDQGDEATVTVSSKLHFVDLAGSERLKLFFWGCF
jgi:kinesin family protein 4/21/27